MSDFEKITPDSLGPWTGGTHLREHNGRPFWRISVWRNGVEESRRDFLFEPLATGWAEKQREQLRERKVLAFVMKQHVTNHRNTQMNDPKKWVVTWYDGNETKTSLIEGVSSNDLGDHLTIACDNRGIDPSGDIHSIVEIASKNAIVYLNDGVMQLAYNLEAF